MPAALIALPAIAAIGAGTGLAATTGGSLLGAGLGLTSATTAAIGSGASTAMSAGSTMPTGMYQSQAAKDRAIQYQQQTQLDTYNASENVRQIGQKAQSTISEAQAAAGASGITQSGSPQLAIDATINNANAQSTYVRFLGNLRKTSDLYEAQLEKSESQQSLFGGMAGGALSGVSGMWNALKGPLP